MLASLLLLLASDTPKLAPCDAVKIGYAKALDAYPSQDRGLMQALRFSRAESWCGAWTVVTVYRRVRGAGPVWEISRATGDGKTSPPVVTTAWTTSTACPAIFPALESVERIPVRLGLAYPIRVNSPAVEANHPWPDSTGYRLWTTSYADTTAQIVRVELNAGGGAVAKWIDATLQSIRSCLR
jgi:hypothetical protein